MSLWNDTYALGICVPDPVSLDHQEAIS
ncbi:MAG: hypothetical protein JWO56_3489, partial [Acidobacteria bacterium]|nr:hypothetical protein [Acidobacteriota bacterium]